MTTGRPAPRAGRLAWLALLVAGGTWAAELTPHELLDRMNQAVRLLDYEGRFVVQSGDRLDALYLVHRVDDGAEKERVVSLTGKPREIIRSDEAVACLVAGSERPINVGRRAHGRSFSPLNGVSGEQLDSLYEMQLLADGRVAGRTAHQLLIKPRDDLRFGYRLYIDRATGLPLRSAMYDENQTVLSQMMFVELRVDDDITPIEFDLAAMQKARPDDAIATLRERLAPPAWHFTEVPAGFKLNAHRRRALTDGSGALEHFIFSDGLATVSVYVMPTDGEHAMPGVSRLGNAKVVGRKMGDRDVLALGEVPDKTLTLFAQAVSPAR